MDLTQDKKDACHKVVNKQVEENMIEESKQGEANTFASRFRYRMKKRKVGVLEKSQASPFHNVDYICGSAAEVERLRSSCKYILTNTRSRMTPNLFEALIFLKVNYDYWDAAAVQVAYTDALKGSQSDKIVAMINQDDDYAENLDEDQ